MDCYDGCELWSVKGRVAEFTEKFGPPKRSYTKTRTLHFNNLLDAAVAGIFLALVTAIVLLSLREWILLLSRRKPAVLHETEPVWLPDYAVTEGRPIAYRRDGGTGAGAGEGMVRGIAFGTGARQQAIVPMRNVIRQMHNRFTWKPRNSGSMACGDVVEEKMKIGLFGGSFDPVHLGHLLVAQAAVEELGLDRLFFIPAAQSPFKPENKPAPASTRLQWLRLALAGRVNCEVDDQEIRRGGVSYTVDTLRDYVKRFPNAQLFYLIGADNAAKLNEWREAGELAKLAEFVAIPRPGGTPAHFRHRFTDACSKAFRWGCRHPKSAAG